MRDSKTHDKLTANTIGNVNELPITLKLVYNGETLAEINESPALSCHHETNIEMAMTTRVATAPAKPNQFILEGIFIASFS